jgi:anaerobic selenocysteine-containing dehydrogenase
VLENWDLLDSWGTHYLNINQPAIPPLGEAKTNTEFFRLLAREMEFQEPYMYESDLDIIEKTFDSKHEYLAGITFESLKKTGWARLNVPKQWMPHAAGNFKTPSGKCLFYNPDIEPPLPQYQAIEYSPEEMAKYPLQLLTVKSTRYFLNSSHANMDYLLEKEGKPMLDISREDADYRGIADGDEVRVFNQRGLVLMTARIRSKVRKGVVCMPQGYWPSLMKGNSSANALTPDMLADMGGGGAFQENRVDIKKA